MTDKEKRNKRNIIIVIIAIIVFVGIPLVLFVAPYIYFMIDSPNVYKEEGNLINTIESIEEKEVIIHKVGIGEPIDLNGVLWTLNSAIDAGDSMDYMDEYLSEQDANYESEITCNAKEGYKYVVLDFTVENNSSFIIQIYEESLFSVNAEEFESETFAYSCVGNLIYFSRGLMEGYTHNFFAVYEVPYEVNDFKYLLSNILYSDDEVVFDIGF